MPVFLLLILFVLTVISKNNDIFSHEISRGIRSDLVIYGGSSCGLIAAVQAARMGKSVIVIEPTKHLGGMTSNGLGWVDANKHQLIGGLTKEYFHRVWEYYQNDSAWIWEPKHPLSDQRGPYNPASLLMFVLEPHVAEKIFNDMVDDEKIAVLLEQRLDLSKQTLNKHNKISAIYLESGLKIRGQIFIDASYEGDLMAAAGVSYTIGRESNALYNEIHNGIQYNINPQSPLVKISPFTIPGDPTSGLLPRIFTLPQPVGQGDGLLQAFAYRMCLTNIPENRMMVTKPENYDEKEYEIVLRAIESGYPKEKFFKLDLLPNGKTDSNNAGPISTDYIGMNWNWVEADYAARAEIANRHENWQKGLIWTLQNHPRVPESIRDYFLPWGLPKDEFIENDHWPYQLYVREARRMVSDSVITENTALGLEPVTDGITLATYEMDSHYVRYCVTDDGNLITEGGLYVKVRRPFPISYKSIVPKIGEIENLFVPICLSASHVAYGSIRMEPQLMMLGQSTALAACLAIDLDLPVQEVPYDKLQKLLLSNNQILNLPSNYGQYVPKP